jgi:hypothetical protein
MIEVIYKHWTKGHELRVVGSMPRELNNESSDRFVIEKEDGTLEDVIKNTVIRVKEI